MIKPIINTYTIIKINSNTKYSIIITARQHAINNVINNSLYMHNNIIVVGVPLSFKFSSLQLIVTSAEPAVHCSCGQGSYHAAWRAPHP